MGKKSKIFQAKCLCLKNLTLAENSRDGHIFYFAGWVYVMENIPTKNLLQTSIQALTQLKVV